MKTVMLVFGTRPEAIKMCPLVRELSSRGIWRVITAVSGQHRELLNSVLATFGVVPNYDLALMREGQSQQDLVSAMLSSLPLPLMRERPDLVLVHGDTTTTFAAALTCFYLGIPIGHVEAGLRTYDIRAPFPEEFNRRVTGILAQYHFAPTKIAAANLTEEGCSAENVFVTGNTGLDALRFTVRPDYRSPLLTWAKEGHPAVVTLHRRESFGAPMEQMLNAIRRVAKEKKDLRLIFPVHPNPSVKRTAERILGDCPNVRLCPPMDVLDFHNILARAEMILTDSGGIQEEAAALRVPTLVLRDRTERPEGIQSGVLRLAGTDGNGIYRTFSQLCDSPRLRERMKKAVNPFGDGNASARIADILERRLQARKRSLF